MMLDYELLRIVWWLLIGVLLTGFAIMDGFDMGAAALLPFVAKGDAEKRVVINTVGPVWEGNQVWFILGGGAIFAAWPDLYAVAFSGFYLAMFLVLCTLILRPVSFKFRSKMEGTRWRSTWDTCLFISGIVPPVVFGVAFGNALLGVPFTFDETLRMTYDGGLWGLLTPFPLLCGVVSLCMTSLQGATWLTLKTEGAIEARAKKAAIYLGLAVLVLFALAGFWLSAGIDGYRVIGEMAHDGPSNPMLKTVEKASGAWLQNYRDFPILTLVPAIAVLGVLIAFAAIKTGKPLLGFFGSSLVPVSLIGTTGLSMFPFLLPSSLNPHASLLVWDSSSSQGTLMNMAVVTVIFVPIILAYTGWVYHVLRGKVSLAHVKENSHSVY